MCREPGMGRNNTSGNVPGRRRVCETDDFATSNPSRHHDVSILIGIGLGVGRDVGSQPRAKTSMTIMRAPQRGQGQGSTRGSSGGAAFCSLGSTTSGAAPSSSRARAMLAARLLLANKP